MPVEVALVANSFSPREGGAERQMRSLLSGLQTSGRSTVVVTQVIPDVKQRLATIDGVRVLRLGSRRLNRVAPRAAQVIFVVTAAVVVIAHRPRVVISLQMGTASAAAAMAARVLGIQHILRLTGGGTSRHASEPLARADSTLGRAWARFFNRPRTTIVAPAQHLLRDFELSFPSFQCRSTQITNGVIRPDKEVPKTQDVIWYSRAGAERSADAMDSVAASLPDVHFSVLGRGTVPDGVNIDPLGWQASPESVIGRHRVLLNTSPSEGMPNTVLQALAWGTRVVGYDNAGMREVRDLYPNGVQLVTPGDFAAAARAVEEQLKAGALPPQAVPSLDEVGTQWATLLNL